MVRLYLQGREETWRVVFSLRGIWDLKGDFKARICNPYGTIVSIWISACSFPHVVKGVVQNCPSSLTRAPCTREHTQTLYRCLLSQGTQYDLEQHPQEDMQLEERYSLRQMRACKSTKTREIQHTEHLTMHSLVSFLCLRCRCKIENQAFM